MPKIIQKRNKGEKREKKKDFLFLILLAFVLSGCQAKSREASEKTESASNQKKEQKKTKKAAKEQKKNEEEEEESGEDIQDKPDLGIWIQENLASEWNGQVTLMSASYDHLCEPVCGYKRGWGTGRDLCEPV